MLSIVENADGTQEEECVKTEDATVSMGVTTTLQDNETQTETVFGLEDLPIVKEIVRKTIAKTKRNEAEQFIKQTDMGNRPINGIFTCPLCAKVTINLNLLCSPKGATYSCRFVCPSGTFPSNNFKTNVGI